MGCRANLYGCLQLEQEANKLDLVYLAERSSKHYSVPPDSNSGRAKRLSHVLIVNSQT